MIGFSYVYKSPEEILAGSASISNLWVIDMWLVIFAVAFTLVSVYMIIPSIIITHEHLINQKKKKAKKKLLTQILLQKEIEDEVEKEVKIEEEVNVI